MHKLYRNTLFYGLFLVINACIPSTDEALQAFSTDKQLQTYVKKYTVGVRMFIIQPIDSTKSIFIGLWSASLWSNDTILFEEDFKGNKELVIKETTPIKDFIKKYQYYPNYNRIDNNFSLRSAKSEELSDSIWIYEPSKSLSLKKHPYLKNWYIED